jgi:DNA-binding NarL/FixJ family response regulator
MKILIVEDHETVRKGIHTILASDFDTEHIMEAVDGDEAVQIAQGFQPDLILMDITMPKLDGIEATRQILTQDPDIQIIMLSMHTKNELIMDSFKAGCKGFVSKTLMLEELVTAIREVSQGNKYLSSDISNVVSDEVLENGTAV